MVSPWDPAQYRHSDTGEWDAQRRRRVVIKALGDR
jgi:hypothetical protein